MSEPKEKGPKREPVQIKKVLKDAADSKEKWDNKL